MSRTDIINNPRSPTSFTTLPTKDLAPPTASVALRRLVKEVYLFDYHGEPHGLRKRAAQNDYPVRIAKS